MIPRQFLGWLWVDVRPWSPRVATWPVSVLSLGIRLPQPLGLREEFAVLVSAGVVAMVVHQGVAHWNLIGLNPWLDSIPPQGRGLQYCACVKPNHLFTSKNTKGERFKLYVTLIRIPDWMVSLG